MKMRMGMRVGMVSGGSGGSSSGEKEGAMVGGSVVGFVSELSDQNRSDVGCSTLNAQLVADFQTGGRNTDIENWYYHYQNSKTFAVITTYQLSETSWILLKPLWMLLFLRKMNLQQFNAL